ncbi:ubiquitin-conjugating enzyme E2 D3 isoform X3 [Dromiciops gliroides]|uniref:ubiquitin-conjugating enzyme E2 D3 isoform X3 n=1 Tax=Dromiciops gliroides TaxID=33562 RepID=UPI001CC555C9|nr:ubiquitin-conjugating enzyme E2 D3 isoform X3 [Dromiciops gliroides]
MPSLQDCQAAKRFSRDSDFPLPKEKGRGDPAGAAFTTSPPWSPSGSRCFSQPEFPRLQLVLLPPQLMTRLQPPPSPSSLRSVYPRDGGVGGLIRGGGEGARRGRGGAWQLAVVPSERTSCGCVVRVSPVGPGRHQLPRGEEAEAAA